MVAATVGKKKVTSSVRKSERDSGLSSLLWDFRHPLRDTLESPQGSSFNDLSASHLRDAKGSTALPHIVELWINIPIIPPKDLKMGNDRLQRA